MTGADDAPERLGPSLLPMAIWAAVVAFTAIRNPLGLYGMPVDDAWIHQVYAAALASGQGLSYDGLTSTTGTTSPLWVLVTAPAHLLPSPWEVVATKGIGFLLGAALLSALPTLSEALTGRRLAGILAAGLLAIDGRLLFAALSGMEDLLLATLWMWAATTLVRGRVAYSAGLAGAAVVTRPEAVLLVPLWLIAAVALPGRDKRPSPQLLAACLALIAGPQLIWTALCVAWTGYPLPLTFYVKVSRVTLDPHRVLGVVISASQAGYSRSPALLAGLITGGFALKARATPPRQQAAVLLGVGPLLYLAALALTRDFQPAGFYWTRYTDAAVLVWTSIALLGLSGVLTAAAFKVSEPARGLASAAVLISIPLALWSLAERVDQLETDSQAIDRLNGGAADWLADHTEPGEWIGVNDAGLIRYRSGRRTQDLIGLNDAQIALTEVRGVDIVQQRPLDWLAVAPVWWKGRADRERIIEQFEAVADFRVSPEAYTVCPCPDQNSVQIWRRRPQTRSE